MRFLIFLVMSFSLGAEAYTLNNNFGGAFKKNKVSVYVASDTVCSNAGVTADELAELVKPAVDDFWNKVPTSALRLKAAGFAAPVGTNINSDRLCAPTDENCINTSTAPLIPPINEILIACNSNDANFGGPSGTNVLAVTVPNNFSGRKIVGAIILINDFSPVFSTLSRADKISVLAHEIGHAIGLGHAESENNEALMYYKTVNLRTSLSQDDMRGVSYLYPIKTDGCGLLGGIMTTPTDSKGPPFWQMGAALALLVLVFELLKLFKRPKTCTPA
ncbi:MAG TPA: matrixin family metalloprotease [Bacteriovoracaceae bacterium]|nr:matrixin family metalloprotease [Bacteriovoracaceae bacterium]